VKTNVFRTAIPAILIINIIIPAILLAQPIDMTKVQAEEEFHYGINAFHLGFFGKALTSFEDAQRLDPQSPLIKSWLARTYFRMGLEDTALSMWRGLAASGKGSPLLDHITRVVDLRRGLGRELFTPDKYVLNATVDGSLPQFRNFKRPSAVYSKPDGGFFLVVYGTGEIISFDVNTRITGVYRGGIESVNHPFDIIRVGNFYYITEYEGDVVTKLDLDLVKVASFGGRGIAEGKLLGPQFLASDSSGALYVTDWGNRRVNKYDPDGKFILSFGRKSPMFPEMNFKPTGIAVMGDKVYVADQFKKRIAVFDINGNYLSSIGDESLLNPEGLYLDKDRYLIVADTTRIMQYDLSTESWNELCDLATVGKRITDITFTPNGDILAADFDSSKLFIIAESSSLYSGFFCQVERIDSKNFPAISAEISVEDLFGNPIVGLASQNFFITENSVPAKDIKMGFQNTSPQPLSTVLVIEDSPDMNEYAEEIKLAVRNVAGILGKDNRLKIVFARDEGVLEADFGKTDFTAIDALIDAAGTASWNMGRSLRQAVAELLPSRGRCAVVFLTSGKLTDQAFDLYSLVEVTRYLRNNHVRFYPVYIGSLEKNNEIEYIRTETSGKTYLYFNPEGLSSLLNDILSQPGSTYLLTYTAPTDSEFGRKFIQMEVQVLLHKKSGRDESGYYGPLIYK